MGKIFDFAYTCPDIDKQIKYIQSELLDLSGEIIEDICPHLSGPVFEKLKQDWARSMYERLEEYIEAIRSTNSEMRHSAEDQLSDLRSEMDTLQKDCKHYQDKTEELESNNEQLAKDKEELQKDLDEANARLETTGYFD